MEKGLAVVSDTPGWYTSPKTRPHLISAVRAILGDCYRAITNGDPPPVKDLALIEEAKRFILNKNGRYEATPGWFDDRIFALGLTEKCAELYHRSLRTTSGLDEPLYTDDDTYYLTGDGEIMGNLQGWWNRARRSARTSNTVIF